MTSNARRNIELIGHRILVFILTAVFVFPFLWVIVLSFRSSRDIFGPTLRVFAPFTLENYITVFSELGFHHLLLNTFIIAALTTLLGLVIGVPAGYAIARWNVGGKWYLLWVITLRLFPTITILLPSYIFFQRIGLIDTFVPIVIMLGFLSLPLTIWLSRGFFMQIPREIEEAALIDGCSTWQALMLIAVPIVRPGITVAVIFSFVLAWNNFLIPLTLTFQNWQTLTVGSSQLITDIEIRWGAIMAASTLAILPVLLLVTFARDLIMKGFVGGTR